MEENRFKTFGFFLKSVLLLQLVYSINYQSGAEATQSELHVRMSKIEDQNRRHEKEISLLKTEKVEDRKEIHQLRERVALLEDSTFTNASSAEKPKRLKRPVRLLPPYIFRPHKNTHKDETEEEATTPYKRFYGPPTNCDELHKLGYTLNGYYLIKGNKGKLDNSNRIQVVYCQFLQPPGTNKQSFDSLIGNVQVKTKSVHFYVQRKTKYRTGTESGYIAFDVEQLNIGGAMNLNTGEFTAPVDGIYHFEFRCLKDEVPNDLAIYLVVKEKIRTIPPSVVITGNIPIVAATWMSNISYYSTGSITTSLKLKASDVVKIYSQNRRGYLYDSGARFTQFAGWLVEEDLVVA